MRTDVPSVISDEVHELTPQSLVKLYEIHLKDGAIFRISPENQVIWQGNVYNDIPATMTDFTQEANGKLTRPKFTFANPAGVFTADLYNGLMNNADVIRLRIRYSDLLADNNFALKETFRVSKILTMNKFMASVELRDVLDGHNFKLPARAFYPPEFPHVRL